MGFCLQYGEDGSTHSSVYQQAWSLQGSPLPLALSVFFLTPSSFDCYSQLAESTFYNMRNPKIFFHISVQFLRFLVYIFYDMCYISLMVNGYISWILLKHMMVMYCKHKRHGAQLFRRAKRTGNSTAGSFKSRKKKLSMFLL